MRRYETFVIIDPDVSEEDRTGFYDRVKELIHGYDGFLAVIDEWGIQKLAYQIKKKPRGYYVRFDYCGTGPLVDELERNFRIDDRILKFMTVLLEPEADLDAIKAAIAEKLKAEEAKAAEKATAAAAAESSKDAAPTPEAKEEDTPVTEETPDEAAPEAKKEDTPVAEEAPEDAAPEAKEDEPPAAKETPEEAVSEAKEEEPPVAEETPEDAAPDETAPAETPDSETVEKKPTASKEDE